MSTVLESGLKLGLNLPISKAAVRIMTPWLLNSADRMIDYGTLEADIAPTISNITPDQLLTFVSNHQSHLDLAVALQVVSIVRKHNPNIGSIFLPVAASLVRGKQGPVADVFYHQGGKIAMEKKGIVPLSVLTYNDENKRKMKPTREDTTAMIQALKETNSAMFVLPEATVEAGKFDTQGNPYGMQEVQKPFLKVISRASDREVIVVPIAISGTSTMLSAETRLPTIAGLKTLAMQQFGRNRIMASVRAGEAINLRQYESLATADDSIMREIAKMLPANQRGYYAL